MVDTASTVTNLSCHTPVDAESDVLRQPLFVTGPRWQQQQQVPDELVVLEDPPPHAVGLDSSSDSGQSRSRMAGSSRRGNGDLLGANAAGGSRGLGNPQYLGVTGLKSSSHSGPSKRIND